MNNAVYFELIDTAVNAHLAEAVGIDIRTLPAIGVVAEVSCRYFREIGYPEPVDLGMVVDKVGTSSVIYRIGLFQGDPEGAGAEAAAEGRFVHVYVDNTGDRAEGRSTARSPSRCGRPSYPCCGTDLVRRVRIVGNDIPPTKEPPWEPSWSCCCSPSCWPQRSCCTSPIPTAASRPRSRPCSVRRCGAASTSLPTLDPEPASGENVSIAPRAQVDSHR